MTIYEQVQNALDHMEAHLGNELSLEQASRASAMSERSFTHWFKALTGRTFKDHLLARRLETAARALLDHPDRTILDIALEAGYGTHESFTRAFAKVWNLSPREFRARRPPLEFLGPLVLYKEQIMELIITRLPAFRAAVFRGFAPEPEDKAHTAMESWLATVPGGRHGRRILGHNIKGDGSQDNNPRNTGYQLMVSLQAGENPTDVNLTEVAGGTFAVIGVEGSFAEDPEGRWITGAWARMNQLLASKGHKVHPAPRWFEEELEPSAPGKLRLDLMLELAEP